MRLIVGIEGSAVIKRLLAHLANGRGAKHPDFDPADHQKGPCKRRDGPCVNESCSLPFPNP